MEPITSTRNPRVRELATLSRSRVRRERGQHLVEGPHAVAEALRAGVVEELFVVAGGLADVVVPPGTTTTEVADHVLERLADTTTPQGIVALARSATVPLADVVGTGLLVVCDAVSDPGNAGTIIRTADAAGAAAVALTAGSVDPFSPKAVRAAAGSTYHLPLVLGVDLAEVASACRAAGQRVLGLDGSATASVFDLQAGTGPVALVLGNEAHGLSPSAVGVLDDLVAVPIHGRAESLNVGAAAAVALYAAAEGLRRSARQG